MAFPFSTFPRLLRIGLCLMLACVPPIHVFGADGPDDMRAALDAFTGEWEGDVRIHALDGYLLKTFPVTRTYAWDGGEQVVETRFHDGESEYVARARQFVRLGRLQAEVNRPGMPLERYQGAIADGGVAWTNSERNSRDFREKTSTRGNTRTLETTSAEIMRLKGVSGLVRVVLVLTAKRGAPAGLVSAVAPQVSATPSARLIELEESLARAGREAEQARAETLRMQAQMESLRVREKDLVAQLTQARAASAAAPDPAALATARDAAEIARKEAREAQAEVARLSAERDATARTLAEVQTREAALKATLDTARGESEKAASASTQAQRDNEALSRRLQTIEQERAAAIARADAAERTALSAAAATRQGRVAGDAELTDLRARLDQANRDTDAAMRRAERVQTERDDLAGKLADTERTAALRGTEAATAAQLRITLSQREAELAESRRRAEQAGQDAAGLKERLAALEKAGTSGDQAAREAERRIAMLEREREAALGRHATLERQLAEANLQREQITTERDQLAAKLSAAEAAATKRTVDASSATAGVQTMLTQREAELVEARRQFSQAARDTETLNRRVATLEREADVLRRQAVESEAAKARAADEIDSLKQRVVSLDEQIGQLADAEKRYERAEGARLEAIARVSELEAQVRTISQTRLSTDEATTLRQQLARALEDADSAKRQFERERSEREAVSTRLAERESLASNTQSDLGRLQQEVAAANQKLSEAEKRILQAETDLATVATLRAELRDVRSVSEARQRDNERLATRARELESRPAGGAAPSTGVFSAEQWSAQVEKLERRVLEAESERNSMRGSLALLESQIAEARQLRDDTLARFQDVVSQLNAARDDRDRFARANLSLQSELRATRSAPAPASAASGPGESGSMLNRFLSSISGETAPAPAPTGTRTVDTVIAGLEVVGASRTGGEEKVILDGRVYRAGDVVDAELGLVFERIDASNLVFKDGRGREYRRRF